MRNPFKKQDEERNYRFDPNLRLDRMFETRSHTWEQVGLPIQQTSRKSIRRAQRQAIVLLPLLIGVLIAWSQRKNLFGPNAITSVQIGTVVALVVLGWTLALALGRAAAPTFFTRMDPATAGTVGFLIRLATIAITLVLALHVVGFKPGTIAAGGAFTAVIFGLAAQQTLGNVIAGMVLLSARPFRVGERIRLQAGAVGGVIEGVVLSLGLLYTTLLQGREDRILIPNNVVLAAPIIPLIEPDSVDVRIVLPSGIRPSRVQAILDDSIKTPTRARPRVLLEEVDGNKVVVRIQATPDTASEGARLADEIIGALASVTGEHAVLPD